MIFEIMPTSTRIVAGLLLIVVACWVVFAATGAGTGPYSIDELVYQAMVDGFARNHSLAVSNGYSDYPSESLKLWVLVEYSGQLYPQYPSGWAVVASPAYLLAGVRGVIFVNTLAAIATVLLVWISARAIFDDVRPAFLAALLYALATFAVDYAFGIWPHAASTCLLTVALAALATSHGKGDGRELAAIGVAGLAVGLAMNLRTDSVIAVPIVGLWALTTFNRPFRALWVFALALAPGLLLAAAMNFQKFGMFSPLTYGRQGRSGGATNLGFYAPLLPLVIVASILSLALGFQKVRVAMRRPAVVMIVLALAVLTALLLPPVGDVVHRLVTGLWVLVFDFQSFPDTNRPEVVALGDGTFRFWGLAKKSLIHSVPYAAGILVLWRGRAQYPPGSPLWLCLLMCCLWVLPFSFGQFHGGLSNNMRYFGPILPALSILAVAAWKQMPSTPTNWRSVLLIGFLIVLAASIPPHLKGQPPYYIWDYAVPGVLATLLAVLSMIFVVGGSRVDRALFVTMWRAVFVACVALATVSAYYFDLSVSQSQRARNQENARLFSDLPADSLVLSFAPEAAGYWLNQPSRMTSQAEWRNGSFDAGLVQYAFDSGRRVVVQGDQLAGLVLKSGLAMEARPLYGIEPPREIYELTRQRQDIAE